MKLVTKIWIYLFLLISTIVFGQTPGFNYQALILNNVEIQIPGTNVKENKVPLASEDITIRFTITNEQGIEYVEEHDVTTDENGMISLIVGEGTPISFTFENINWDGELKYLNVELDILSNNEGFVFLDTQKILYIPHPTNGNGTIKIVNALNELTPPYKLGELIWITNYGPNKNPSLMIWNGYNWLPVNDDFDPTNELGLVVVENDAARAARFVNPENGDQVWNKTCKCIQVFDAPNWVSISGNVTNVLNGLTNESNTIKLGGNLTEATQLVTNAANTLAIKGLQESTNQEDVIIAADKDTGVLKTKKLNDFLQKKQIVIIATEGQLEFKTPLNITNSDKLDVYRNGVRIDFTILNSTTIKLEPEAICYKNDKIRIVQLN
ncbi:hypothetical protein [Polaribacter glomeratus]|nr:hypothetical protein [Polaribacter glomeratus]TXD64609.1 hypothetical protein ESX12_13775 [Polaribacter glomeratus]